MGSMTDNHAIDGDRNEIKEPYVLPSPGARQHFALIDLARSSIPNSSASKK